jgi:hypothetical protein
MPRLVDTCLKPKRRCIGLHHRSQEGSSIGAVVERWLSIFEQRDLKHIAARVSTIVADRRRRPQTRRRLAFARRVAPMWTARAGGSARCTSTGSVSRKVPPRPRRSIAPATAPRAELIEHRHKEIRQRVDEVVVRGAVADLVEHDVVIAIDEQQIAVRPITLSPVAEGSLPQFSHRCRCYPISSRARGADRPMPRRQLSAIGALAEAKAIAERNRVIARRDRVAWCR